MRTPSLLAFLASAVFVAAAEDGAQVYNSLCVACHGPDGKGLNGLPPLVGSEWPKGPAERSIKIVLNGLTGPVEVAGKVYNIDMPPQGSVLSDEKIAAALTYVRKSFAASGPVTADQVRAVRAATASRTTPWTAAELLKDHPFPPAKTALKHLVGTLYKGTWKEMTDFSSAKPSFMQDYNVGVLDPAQSGLKENFAMVWEAQFEAPVAGKYDFIFDCDDFGSLYVNGERVAEIKGVGTVGPRKKEVQVLLKKGASPLRVEYVQLGGEQILHLAYKGPKDKAYQWLSKGKTAKPEKSYPSIPVMPHGGVAAVYRNFIAGTTPRAIGFGFPNGLNLAYSADNLAAELMWTGKFMDGGHHWTDRGKGNEPPAGNNVVKVSDGQAVALASGKPGEVTRYVSANDGKFKAIQVAAEFKGYDLDAAGNPTFRSAGSGATITDAWVPGGSDAKPVLTRTLKAAGEQAVTIVLARGAAKADAAFELPGGLLISPAQGVAPQLSAEKTLTLTLRPGESAVLGYSFR